MWGDCGLYVGSMNDLFGLSHLCGMWASCGPYMGFKVSVVSYSVVSGDGYLLHLVGYMEFPHLWNGMSITLRFDRKSIDDSAYHGQPVCMLRFV